MPRLSIAANGIRLAEALRHPEHWRNYIAWLGITRDQRMRQYYTLRGKANPIRRVRVSGVSMDVDLRCCGVAYPLYVDRAYERAETAYLRRRLRKGLVFCDIGANIGYFTLVAARSVGCGGVVMAFEPDPYNFQLLNRNIVLNRFANTKVMNCALGASAGYCDLYQSSENFGDHRVRDSSSGDRNAFRVPMLALDAAVEQCGLRYVDIVKMDVQGYEKRVQDGMLHLLNERRIGEVLAEVWPAGLIEAGTSPEILFSSFQTHGYAPWRLKSDGLLEETTYQETMQLLPDSMAHTNIVFRGE